jgi:hypothetical protein
VGFARDEPQAQTLIKLQIDLKRRRGGDYKIK